MTDERLEEIRARNDFLRGFFGSKGCVENNVTEIGELLDEVDHLRDFVDGLLAGDYR